MRAAGGGSVVNVSSVAALYPHPSLMAYGMAKVALERLTVDAANSSADAADGVAVDCFRPSTWPSPRRGSWPTPPGPTTPTSGALRGGRRRHRLDGAAARRPYSGRRRESMFALRRREGIMASRVAHPATQAPPAELTRRPGGRRPDRVRRALPRRSRRRSDESRTGQACPTIQHRNIPQSPKGA